MVGGGNHEVRVIRLCVLFEVRARSSGCVFRATRRADQILLYSSVLFVVFCILLYSSVFFGVICILLCVSVAIAAWPLRPPTPDQRARPSWHHRTTAPPHHRTTAPPHHCLPPSAHCPLPTAHCPLPTAHCPLPTAHCPLPTARLRRTTRTQPPPTTANHRHQPPFKRPGRRPQFGEGEAWLSFNARYPTPYASSMTRRCTRRLRPSHCTTGIWNNATALYDWNVP
jgi:hypothetical protein